MFEPEHHMHLKKETIEIRSQQLKTLLRDMYCKILYHTHIVLKTAHQGEHLLFLAMPAGLLLWALMCNAREGHYNVSITLTRFHSFRMIQHLWLAAAKHCLHYWWSARSCSVTLSHLKSPKQLGILQVHSIKTISYILCLTCSADEAALKCVSEQAIKIFKKFCVSFLCSADAVFKDTKSERHVQNFSAYVMIVEGAKALYYALRKSRYWKFRDSSDKKNDICRSEHLCRGWCTALDPQVLLFENRLHLKLFLCLHKPTNMMLFQ